METLHAQLAALALCAIIIAVAPSQCGHPAKTVRSVHVSLPTKPSVLTHLFHRRTTAGPKILGNTVGKGPTRASLPIARATPKKPGLIATVLHRIEALPTPTQHTATTLPPAITPTVTSKLAPAITPLVHRLGVGKTINGSEVITYDIIHRDVAIKPLGLRLKLGEWGAGPMVVLPLNHRLDFGPQVNIQHGSTYVGAGYAVRERTPMIILGHKF